MTGFQELKKLFETMQGVGHFSSLNDAHYIQNLREMDGLAR